MPILLGKGWSPPSQESNASLTCLPIVCRCLSLRISEEWQLSLQLLCLIHSPKAEICVEKEDVHSAQYFRWWCLLLKYVFFLFFRSQILYLVSITAPHLQAFTPEPPLFAHRESLFRFKGNSITAPWLTLPSPTPTPRSNLTFLSVFTFQETLTFILFLLGHIHHLV